MKKRLLAAALLALFAAGCQTKASPDIQLRTSTD